MYTILKENKHEAYIYDRRHDLTTIRKKLKQVEPNIVCITGYITQEKLMKKLIEKNKQYNSEIKIIIGGSHVEINYKNYFDSKVDYIYYLSGLENFIKLIQYIDGKVEELQLENIKGIAYKRDNEWVVNDKIIETPETLPIPNRDYFYENKKRFRYLTFKPLALIKNSYSCKKFCSFCFCTNRNSGSYACRSVDNLVKEIFNIWTCRFHCKE